MYFIYYFMPHIQCITPVFKVNGWKITTVEGLGNTKVGLNALQTKMHEEFASQCGFCTPGMVMAMNR